MEEKRGRERTNARRREGSGRGQTKAFGVEVGMVGGVTAAGQLWCHHDSGEGEEKGWSHTSQEEAAPLVVHVSLRPSSSISLQQLECCFHSKVTAAAHVATS